VELIRCWQCKVCKCFVVAPKSKHEAACGQSHVSGKRKSASSSASNEMEVVFSFSLYYGHYDFTALVRSGEVWLLGWTACLSSINE
jgi:hypothetical protein